MFGKSKNISGCQGMRQISFPRKTPEIPDKARQGGRDDSDPPDFLIDLPHYSCTYVFVYVPLLWLFVCLSDIFAAGARFVLVFAGASQEDATVYYQAQSRFI